MSDIENKVRGMAIKPDAVEQERNFAIEVHSPTSQANPSTDREEATGETEPHDSIKHAGLSVRPASELPASSGPLFSPADPLYALDSQHLSSTGRLTIRQKAEHHRLFVEGSRPLKRKALHDYRDAVEQPQNGIKELGDKCLTCIKNNRACTGTVLKKRVARNKTTYRCETCMPQGSAHCGRACYWKDAKNNVFTYEDAQVFHKGIRNPKNSRLGRQARALAKKGHRSSPQLTYAIALPVPTDRGPQAVPQPECHDLKGKPGLACEEAQERDDRTTTDEDDDNDEDDDEDDDSSTMQRPETTSELVVDQIFREIESEARKKSNYIRTPSEADIYFKMTQLLFAKKSSMPRSIYGAVWQKLQLVHVQFVHGEVDDTNTR
ncbi:hypothetical protein LTR51_002130 [Lithohypha guttulata]|nr:hypothetical protein LTR51_002130 [Lithohypha guttulata]